MPFAGEVVKEGGAALQYAPRPSVCGTAGREGAHDGFDNRLTSRSLAWQGRGWHRSRIALAAVISGADRGGRDDDVDAPRRTDRKSTRLNSSHVSISYAVFCLKKKKRQLR